jgi:hypothetical protein
MPILHTYPALAVASNAAFWHKNARSAELVPQIVGPVAGTFTENLFCVALVDFAPLVADPGRLIADDV